MLSSFLIFLREGIEGCMIITIMCTYLAAVGRRDLMNWILAGAGAALLGSAAVGTAIYLIAADAFVGSRAQLWFETATFGLAVVVLTYMTFWMKSNARRISATLKEQVTAAAAGGSGAALVVLAFVTVGREALETAIFLAAIAMHNSTLHLLGGAIAGLAVALALSLAIFRLGVRAPMQRFFTWIGAALMVVAAGLLANAIQNLQELGVLPGTGSTVWDTGAVVPQDSIVGDILHGLIGYSAAPTTLQALVWTLFLIAGMAAFLHEGSSTRRPAR